MIHIMITKVCPHQNNALEGVLACAYVVSLLRHAPLATPTYCDASIISFPPTHPAPIRTSPSTRSGPSPARRCCSYTPGGSPPPLPSRSS